MASAAQIVSDVSLLRQQHFTLQTLVNTLQSDYATLQQELDAHKQDNALAKVIEAL